MRIVFLGTPDFAVPSLRALLGEAFDIVGVVTQPDKPRGRSRSKLVAPPVKMIALEEGLEVLQPVSPKDPAFVEQLKALQPDLGVVVAYGHILRPNVLALPTNGMINVHASLLPKLRGAAPVHYAIREGLRETGISIMQMDEGLDSGPVLHQVPTPIAVDETSGELHNRLAETGALALIETVLMLELGKVTPVAQKHQEATFAPKITRSTAHIDWGVDATAVGRHIRAMDPVPGAWTTWNGQSVKLFGPSVKAMQSSHPPGTVVDVTGGLRIATATEAVEVEDIQPEGRRRVRAMEWLRGQRVVVGDCFA